MRCSWQKICEIFRYLNVQCDDLLYVYIVKFPRIEFISIFVTSHTIFTFCVCVKETFKFCSLQYNIINSNHLYFWSHLDFWIETKRESNFLSGGKAGKSLTALCSLAPYRVRKILPSRNEWGWNRKIRKVGGGPCAVSQMDDFPSQLKILITTITTTSCGLLCARNCAKHFVFINSFDPNNYSIS